jgi:type I restriction enzyme S subunit
VHSLRELGRWAVGSGFPLAEQGLSDLPILFCKVGDMNRPGNEIWIKTTQNSISYETANRLRIGVHPRGTVIFPKIGGAIATNKRRVLASPSAIDNNVLGVVPDESVDSLWLHQLLAGIELSRFQSGTSVPALKQSVLEGIAVPKPPLAVQRRISRFMGWLAAKTPSDTWESCPQLPRELSEQRRIVARIEELAAKVEEAKGTAGQSLGATMALFSSALSSEWSKTTAWAARSVNELVELVSGQVDPRFEPYASLPHISGDNIEPGTCRLLPYRTAEQDQVQSGNYHFKADSVLYSKIRPYLKKAVQVPVEGVCSADIYAFDSIDSSLEPRFLMYSLIAPDFTAHANMLSGRTRMPKLNQKQLLSYNLHYPPVKDQRRIVAYLDSLQAKVDELKKLQAETQAELDALLPSILDKAFKGEL